LRIGDDFVKAIYRGSEVKNHRAQTTGKVLYYFHSLLVACSLKFKYEEVPYALVRHSEMRATDDARFSDYARMRGFLGNLYCVYAEGVMTCTFCHQVGATISIKKPPPSTEYEYYHRDCLFLQQQEERRILCQTKMTE
jgi:hypothetical protein